MEALKIIVSIIFILALISVPILLFIGIKKRNKLKYDFVIYLVFGVLITAGIIWISAWWGFYSTKLLMSHYGHDFDAMNDVERYENIEPKNFERVKNLEHDYLGNGWPLKAIVAFILYSPYLLIVYFGGWLIRRTKRKKKERIKLNK